MIIQTECLNELIASLFSNLDAVFLHFTKFLLILDYKKK